MYWWNTYLLILAKDADCLEASMKVPIGFRHLNLGTQIYVSLHHTGWNSFPVSYSILPEISMCS